MSVLSQAIDKARSGKKVEAVTGTVGTGQAIGNARAAEREAELRQLATRNEVSQLARTSPAEAPSALTSQAALADVRRQTGGNAILSTQREAAGSPIQSEARRREGLEGLILDRMSTEELTAMRDRLREQAMGTDPALDPEGYDRIASRGQAVESALLRSQERDYYTALDQRILEAEGGATQAGAAAGLSNRTSIPNKPMYDELRNVAQYLYLEANGDPIAERYGNAMDYKVGQMTQKQKDTVLSYIGTGEFDRAREYLSDIERGLNEQANGQFQSTMAQWAQEHPVQGAAANIFSWPFSIPATVENLGQAVKNKVTGEYVPADVNSDAYLGARIGLGTSQGVQEAAREAATDTFGSETAGSVASFLAGTGLSIGQNLTQLPLGPLALAGMGASASGTSTVEALDRGATPGQAAALGLSSGVIEALTEKLPLDNLFRIAGSGKQTAMETVKNILRQMGTEATEEAISEVAGNVVDAAVMRDRSEFQSYVRQLEEQGMSRTEAEQRAFLQFYVYNTLQSAAGGALSGGLMGGGASLVNAALSRGPAQTTESRPTEGETIDQAYQAMEESGPFSPEARAAAGETSAGTELARRAELPHIAQAVQEDGGRAQGWDPKTPILPYAAPEGQNNTASTGEARNGGETVSIIQSLKNNIPALSELQPVYSVSLQSVQSTNGNTMAEKARTLFDRIKGIVTRQGFGDIEINARSVKDDLSHGVGPAKAAVIPAIPSVIQNGTQIDFQQNWKGRPYDGYVFAAPVTMDGNTVYVAAVVKRTSKNRFYLHEVIDSSGNIIKIGSEEGANQTSLAANGDAGTQSSLPIDNSISQTAQNVNYKQKIKGPTDTGSNANEAVSPAHNAQSVPPSGPSGNSIPQTAQNVNRDLWSGVVLPRVGDETVSYDQAEQDRAVRAEDSVGAAPSGFDPYSQMLNEYGAIPAGEDPARVVDVPVSTNGEDRVSRAARTVMEAQATPESMLGEVADAILRGDLSHDVITDKAAMAQARGTVEAKGWDGALEEFHQAARSGRLNKYNTALGQVLLNNAMNAGDSKAAIDLLVDYASLSTAAAQTLQAQRMLKKLTPEGQLYSVQRSVAGIQEELRNKYGDKAPDLEIPEALIEEFRNAEDQAGRESAEEEIYKSIAAQVPSTWRDKWNAWRYMAMLTNPRTHIRNIVGNAGFVPIRAIKNAIATTAEAAVDHLSPGGIKRTKAALNYLSKADRALTRAAYADVSKVQNQLLGSGKYADTATGKIEDYRTIFKLKPLEAVRKGNSDLMEAEDAWFSKPAYAGALAGFFKANGVSAQQVRDGTVDQGMLNAGRSYAIHEAQKATYRDANWLSDKISKVRANGNDAGSFVLNSIIEGVLPFRRTPANILMRGVEYSPVGLVKGLSYDLAQVKQGKMTGAEAIDNIAAGLTGTILLGLGAFMASNGAVTGGGSGDDKEDALDDMSGMQNYALNIGDRNYTLDWLAPEALPFFVGVEIYNVMADKSEGGVKLNDIYSAIERITDPMLEMSMLQGVQDAIDTVKNADGGTLLKIAGNSVLSYLTQAVPTLFGQIERTAEDQRYTTFVDRNSGIPSDLQYTIGRVMNKLPGEYQQIPYVDAWGRTESTGNVLERIFNNFINPSYTSSNTTTPVIEETRRLYELTGDGSVVASRPSADVTINGEKIYLDAGQYLQYSTYRGQTQEALLSGIINTPAYQSLDPQDQVAVVSDVYTYATETAKAMLFQDYELDGWVKSAMNSGIDTGDYILFRAATSGLEADRDEEGEAIPGTKKRKVLEAIDQMDLTQEEKDALYLSYGYAESSIGSAPWN